jgi:cytochrome c oxidase assembly protein subunit 15
MTSMADSVAAPRPARSDALVRAHLWLTAALVAAIVVVGGATRLTESGLSITEWNLVTGVLPPLTEEGWLAEFEKYRRIPQFGAMNADMTLADFRVIYLWEWAHRLLGRVIGLVYLAGFALLLATRRVGGALAWKMAGIGALIGLQGAIGWWMVSSGLVDRVTVAPYRLGAHLTLACLIFAGLIWLARGLEDRAPAAAPRRVVATANALLVLVASQIYLGALVAGTRSGWAYQTWPLMDGGLWPAGMGALVPWWTNLFENMATTQFMHRMTAYLILAVAIWHAFDARRAPAAVRSGAIHVAGAVLVQAAIGVATLWSGMNIYVALAHQAWILAVIGAAVDHRARMRAAPG